MKKPDDFSPPTKKLTFEHLLHTYTHARTHAVETSLEIRAVISVWWSENCALLALRKRLASVKTITWAVNCFCLKLFSVHLSHVCRALCAFSAVLRPFFVVPRLLQAVPQPTKKKWEHLITMK